VLAAPLLSHAPSEFRRESVSLPDHCVADLESLLVPTRLVAVGGSWAAAHWRSILGPAGRPKLAGGMLVYRLEPSAPDAACGA
jgi:hypothetical protein